MKFNFHNILPLALAIVFPGLRLFTKSGLALQDGTGFFLRWLYASMFIFIAWYFLWYLWDFRANINNRKFHLTVLAFAILQLGLTYLIFINEDVDFEWFMILRFLVGVILLAIIQFALRAQQKVVLLQLEKEQAQSENYRTQLKAIRAQVDPHFLFNSLNTLRSMVRQQHAGSEEFVLSLSDFYRQTLKYNEQTTLPLSEELSILNAYLFLMKSRNEDAVSININVDNTLNDHHLPTLALQAAVENCFKHNSMTSKKPLNIEVSSINGSYVEVSNNMQPKIGDSDASGYGLDLLRKRYELLHIEEGIVVQQTPDQFSVQLKLIPK